MTRSSIAEIWWLHWLHIWKRWSTKCIECIEHLFVTERQGYCYVWEQLCKHTGIWHILCSLFSWPDQNSQWHESLPHAEHCELHAEQCYGTYVCFVPCFHVFCFVSPVFSSVVLMCVYIKLSMLSVRCKVFVQLTHCIWQYQVSVHCFAFSVLSIVSFSCLPTFLLLPAMACFQITLHYIIFDNYQYYYYYYFYS